jgi:predicted DNA binding CopG/RHH family protein
MKNNKNLKKIPNFKNENEERKFWDNHDFSDYIDSFEQVNLNLSKLKPSTKSITIRFPETLLFSLKKIANKNDIPYQSLMKMMLSEQIKKYGKTNL